MAETKKQKREREEMELLRHVRERRVPSKVATELPEVVVQFRDVLDPKIHEALGRAAYGYREEFGERYQEMSSELIDVPWRRNERSGKIIIDTREYVSELPETTVTTDKYGRTTHTPVPGKWVELPREQWREERIYRDPWNSEGWSSIGDYRSHYGYRERIYPLEVKL